MVKPSLYVDYLIVFLVKECCVLEPDQKKEIRQFLRPCLSTCFQANLPDDALANFFFFLKWLAFTHVLAKNILTLQGEENSLQKKQQKNLANHLGQFCSEKDQTERAQHSFLLDS